jgi:hypothetical protein
MKPSDAILQLLESRNNLAQVSASDYAHADLIAARNRCKRARQAVDDLFAPIGMPTTLAGAGLADSLPKTDDSPYLTGTGCPPSDDGYRVTLEEAEHELKGTSFKVARNNGVIRLVIVGTSIDISTRGQLRDAMKVLGVKGSPEKFNDAEVDTLADGRIEITRNGRVIGFRYRNGLDGFCMVPDYAREIAARLEAMAKRAEVDGR